MKLTVISNTFCVVVTGPRYVVTEHNNDHLNQLCDQFHKVFPAQSSP